MSTICHFYQIVESDGGLDQGYLCSCSPPNPVGDQVLVELDQTQHDSLARGFKWDDGSAKYTWDFEAEDLVFHEEPA